MRKREKELARKLLEKLQTAHEEVEKYTSSQNIAKAISILTDCQSAAIKVGTLIEKTEGEGHKTVNKLEEYCELVFTISEKISASEDMDSKNIYNQLNKKLNEILVSLENDVQLRKEALFLPYKASMWDSMESVWQAKDADPEWDAYVVPIPYFDKNPDGSFAEMHNEENQYPDYVQVIHYEDYDIETKHPDEIYIHNPYDENNYVTSVHPYYYSKRLCELTEKLIYIPYYVLDEPPEVMSEDYLEHLKPYVCQPAVLNSEEIWVQSERMKKAYVEILSATYGQQHRYIWEAKVIGKGSPKFDRVKKACQEEQDIPEEWQKIIYKEDGSKKKIIFYNNSVTAFLNAEDKMLTKLKDSLEVFKENKDTVALLWRPHPLMEQTIKSIHPELFEAYLKIVEQYKKEGWGIYDETSDVERAIAISDAYYGDPSSLVQMYEAVEKPIMIQNVDVLNNED